MVRRGDLFRLRRALLAQKDGQNDEGRHREELALPILERLEPKLRRAQVLEERRERLAVQRLLAVVLAHAARRVQRERAEAEQREREPVAAQPAAPGPCLAAPPRRRDHRARARPGLPRYRLRCHCFEPFCNGRATRRVPDERNAHRRTAPARPPAPRGARPRRPRRPRAEALGQFSTPPRPPAASPPGALAPASPLAPARSRRPAYQPGNHPSDERHSRSPNCKKGSCPRMLKRCVPSHSGRSSPSGTCSV